MSRPDPTPAPKGFLQKLARRPRFFSGLPAFLLDWLAGRPGSPAAAPRAAMEEGGEEFRRMSFTFAMIALAAKITRCDGGISRDEFLTFREVFPLQDEESEKIRRLFRLAWEDEAEAEYYARQVVYLYPGPGQAELRRELLFRLCAIALADGPLTAGELRLLSEVGRVFGYNRLQLGRVLASANPAMEPDPLKVLGLKRGATLEQVRRQYHALMRLYHPDRVHAEISYPEAREVATRKSAAINAAYETLTAA